VGRVASPGSSLRCRSIVSVGYVDSSVHRSGLVSGRCRCPARNRLQACKAVTRSGTVTASGGWGERLPLELLEKSRRAQVQIVCLWQDSPSVACSLRDPDEVTSRESRDSPPPAFGSPSGYAHPPKNQTFSISGSAW